MNIAAVHNGYHLNTLSNRCSTRRHTAHTKHPAFSHACCHVPCSQVAALVMITGNPPEHSNLRKFRLIEPQIRTELPSQEVDMVCAVLCCGAVVRELKGSAS